jgi:hypothetical protein
MSHEGLQLCYEEAVTRPVAPKRTTRTGLSIGSGGAGAGAGSSNGAGGPGSASGDLPARGRTGSDGGSSTPVAPPLATAYASPAASSSSSSSSSSAATPATPGAGSRAASAAASPLWYNLGTHFLWIGDRTRQLDHAHVEYFRGVQNPVGIKAGPSSDPAELVALIRRLWPNPRAAPGKIVLITRMGAGSVRAKLPALVRAVQEAGFTSPVVWTCDPMHGNTRVSSNNYKTRDFDDILAELKHTFEVHRELGSRLGGVHFELTGENVTECTGGPEKLLESDLPHRYTTYCDPRLNYAQGMELAFLIAQYLAGES